MEQLEAAIDERLVSSMSDDEVESSLNEAGFDMAKMKAKLAERLARLDQSEPPALALHFPTHVNDDWSMASIAASAMDEEDDDATLVRVQLDDGQSEISLRFILDSDGEEQSVVRIHWYSDSFHPKGLILDVYIQGESTPRHSEPIGTSARDDIILTKEQLGFDPATTAFGFTIRRGL
ncbi:MAG: hypothetical protein AAFV29_21735 [Myxococcota bacterium]